MDHNLWNFNRFYSQIQSTLKQRIELGQLFEQWRSKAIKGTGLDCDLEKEAEIL